MNLSFAYWKTYLGNIEQNFSITDLARVKAVAKRLALYQHLPPIITVAGTNGKGSTVAVLQQVYLAASYRVGSFTSPCFENLSEQVQINGLAASQLVICTALARVDAARVDLGVTLTPFEYHTLAAMLVFQQQALDIVILEVGLGGRLDATNAFDADCAIITSIDFDHMAVLGNTLNEIACEKAGIFRAERPIVLAEAHLPPILFSLADGLSAPLYAMNRDYFALQNNDLWDFVCGATRFERLPVPQVRLSNAAAAVMAIEAMQTHLPVDATAISAGLQQVHLPGRVEIVRTEHVEIYDVAHNVAAFENLVKKIHDLSLKQPVHVVFSMYHDKEVAACLQMIKPLVAALYLAELNGARAASLEMLSQAAQQAHILPVYEFQDVGSAYAYAKQNAPPGAILVVCGSFQTVASVGQWSSSRHD